jgi:formamidopyrimidine-DNA glycosylase
VPELPEVETTRRGLRAYCEGNSIADVTVRDHRLRWPVRSDLPRLLRGQVIRRLERRAKYLLFCLDTGTLLVHLGMSGSLRVLLETQALATHDHIDISSRQRCAAALQRPPTLWQFSVVCHGRRALAAGASRA